jgi:hypothetical protein
MKSIFILLNLISTLVFANSAPSGGSYPGGVFTPYDCEVSPSQAGERVHTAIIVQPTSDEGAKAQVLSPRKRLGNFHFDLVNWPTNLFYLRHDIIFTIGSYLGRGVEEIVVYDANNGDLLSRTKVSDLFTTEEINNQLKDRDGVEGWSRKISSFDKNITDTHPSKPSINAFFVIRLGWKNIYIRKNGEVFAGGEGYTPSEKFEYCKTLNWPFK